VAYVDAPIVKIGDEVEFMFTLRGTVLDPGPLTKPQNRLGLCPPLHGPRAPDMRVRILHPVLGELEVGAYFVNGGPNSTYRNGENE